MSAPTFNKFKSTTIYGNITNSDYPDSSVLASANFARNVTIGGDISMPGKVTTINTTDASNNTIVTKTTSLGNQIITGNLSLGSITNVVTKDPSGNILTTVNTPNNGIVTSNLISTQKLYNFGLTVIANGGQIWLRNSANTVYSNIVTQANGNFFIGTFNYAYQILLLGTKVRFSADNVNFYDVLTTQTGVVPATLNNYVLSTALTSTLNNYALTSSLNNYALTSSLSNYVTNTTINDYVLNVQLNDYVLNSSLSSYVTNSALSQTLGNYAALSGGGSMFITVPSCLNEPLTNENLTNKKYVDDKVSYGVSNGLLGYAFVISPTFSGVPKAPTATLSDNTTQIATTAFVKNQGYLTASTAGGAPVTNPTNGANNYASITAIASTYQTLAGMSSYLTSGNAASIYQTLSGMSSYLTTALASTNYLTKSSAASTYITTAIAVGVFQPKSDMTNYATLASPTISNANLTGVTVLNSITMQSTGIAFKNADSSKSVRMWNAGATNVNQLTIDNDLTLYNLIGLTSVSCPNLPTSANHLCNKTYVDSLTTGTLNNQFSKAKILI